MIRLCSIEDVPKGTAKRFELDGARIALVRIDDDFYAIGDRCSHADVSLSDGEVLADSKELECWKHGAAFSLETGVPSCLPATRPVPVYRTVLRDGDVYVEEEQ